METLHPGCMVATVTYQERMFDAEVKQLNVDYLLRIRVRLARWLEEIVAKYPPKLEVDVNDLADHLNVVVEGAIIQSKALRDEGMMGRQTRLFRNHIKLLFGAQKRRGGGTGVRRPAPAPDGAGLSRQSVRFDGTLPPFLANSFITALCSQMFISALPSVAPV